MALRDVPCSNCGSLALHEVGSINRAKSRNNNLYCSRECSGIGRRTHKSKAQKVAEKREYDREYRRKNKAMLKAKKHRYFKKTYDPVAAAVDRKKRYPQHLAYLQTDKYRLWKKSYDRKYLAKKGYGEFWECHMLLVDLDNTVREKADFYERAKQKKTVTKIVKRKRDYAKTFSKKLEIGPLG